MRGAGGTPADLKWRRADSYRMGGLMLVAIGFLGEYVWRILDEVRGAPPFIEARHEHSTGRGRAER